MTILGAFVTPLLLTSRSEAEVTWLEFDGSSWRADERASVMELAQRLPIAFANDFRSSRVLLRKVPVRSGSDETLHVGRYRNEGGRPVIELAPAAFDRWSTRAPDVYRAALQRMFIHELAHAYDAIHSVSGSAPWRRISGWIENRLLFFHLSFTRVNQDELGFARQYGMENPQEDFATFAEEFFYPTPFIDVEQTARCRAPSKYRYFMGLFPGWTASDTRPCAAPESWLDPREVEGLELLLAGPTSAAAESLSGHVLLRVVKKRSGHRRSTEIEEADSSRDPVLSFYANTGDSYDSMRGLGLAEPYPARLMEETLGSVVLRYNYLEDRNLARYRLNLTEAELRTVLTRLSEIRNNLTYNYSFFTTNCVTMLVQQLGWAVGEEWLDDALLQTPSRIVTRLQGRHRARPVPPMFPSLTVRKRQALEQIEQRLDQMSSLRISEVPPLSSFSSARESTRLATHSRLLAIGQAGSGQVRSLVYQVLVLCLEVERSLSFQYSHGFSAARSEPYRNLRRHIRALRSLSGSSTDELTRAVRGLESEAERMAAEYSWTEQNTGSPAVGVEPIEVMATYSVAAWQGRLELGIRTSLFREELGARSRLRSAEGIWLTLSDGETHFSLDPLTVNRWRDTLVSLQWVPGSGHDETTFRSLFTGGGMGISVDLLRMRGDAMRSYETDVRWLTGEFIGILAGNGTLRRFLAFTIGLELGSIWLNNDAVGRDRSWLGAPLTLRGDWSTSDGRTTSISGRARATPRLSFEGEGELEVVGGFDLRQLMGNVGEVELLFHAGFETEHVFSPHEANQPVFRGVLGIEGRGL